MKLNKKYFVLFVLTLLFLPAFFSTVEAQDTSLTDVQTRGTLIIGTDATYPPFETYNTTTSEYEGFDIDLAKIICDRLGVTPDFRNTDWGVIFTSLAAEQFDVIISAVTITAVRELSMDFSRWYYKSQQAVMVTTANPESIDTIEDVNSSSINAGIQLGTTSDLYLDDTQAVQAPYETITLAVAALETGSVDVVLGDHATLLSFIKSQPNKFEVVDTFSPEDFGIPVPTGYDALRGAINDILDELLGNNETDPAPVDEYNEIYKEWFDVDAIGYVPTQIQIPGFPIYSLFLALAVGSYVLIRKLKKV
jgi:ABC-type amino acid transport substrate-binding protein